MCKVNETKKREKYSSYELYKHQRIQIHTIYSNLWLVMPLTALCRFV